MTSDLRIRDVWAHNLAEEMNNIRALVERFPYVAMDTEFPGVVAWPTGEFRSSEEFHYQTLRCNVDLLKLIQLGLTFADDRGCLPPGVCTWQFNFKFNLKEDMYAADSIELLTRSGIDFEKHQMMGIDVGDFGELLMSSGLILNESIRWVSFHSLYDFGYLVKLLTCEVLPADEAEFAELLRTYFPCLYDVKFLMRLARNYTGGLQALADQLDVERVGQQHQAGSDAMLTAAAFFKVRQLYFAGAVDDKRYLGNLYGLSPAPQPIAT